MQDGLNSEHDVDRTLRYREAWPAARSRTNNRDVESHRVTSNRKCSWAVTSWRVVGSPDKKKSPVPRGPSSPSTLSFPSVSAG